MNETDMLNQKFERVNSQGKKFEGIHGTLPEHIVSLWFDTNIDLSYDLSHSRWVKNNLP